MTGAALFDGPLPASLLLYVQVYGSSAECQLDSRSPRERVRVNPAAPGFQRRAPQPASVGQGGELVCREVRWADGTCSEITMSPGAISHYEQPLVVPQDGHAKQVPARCICTPHW